MRDERDKQFVQASIDAALSAMRGDPRLAQRIINQERTGVPKVKKRLSVGLILAIVLILATVTVLAVTLLSPKEVVEQVAVPLAKENDREWRVETNFSPEQLAAFIQACNENGIDLDENHYLIKYIIYE